MSDYQDELLQMLQDSQERKMLLKDIFEEMDMDINRLRIIIKGQSKIAVEPLDNECLGDMQ